MPDFSYEIAQSGLVAGVDEAGRGPLSGPVIAAAVIYSNKFFNKAFLKKIDDSKKLKPNERQSLVSKIRKHGLSGIGAASVKEIERYNILNATMLAMRRAVLALPKTPSLALIDGNKAPTLPCPTKTIIKGDTLSISIASASILAKVYRDNVMRALDRRYPEYGWAKNSGYGTRQHLEALKSRGVTPHHRKLFSPVNKILSHS